MNIGLPMREIEIEPVVVPVPGLAPLPQPQSEPVPDAVPAAPLPERHR
jgi:hypothetical protein